jgi:two-component system NarL family sensor kinase
MVRPRLSDYPRLRKGKIAGGHVPLGIEVRVHVGEIVDRLPREIELALFRVLQEALTNVHRHANARSVDVEISCAE